MHVREHMLQVNLPHLVPGVNIVDDESGERRAHLAQRMEQPGFRGTGLLQQEQGLATPHLRFNGGGCETKRQSSGVTEPWSFKRLLLRGFFGPGGEGE